MKGFFKSLNLMALLIPSLSMALVDYTDEEIKPPRKLQMPKKIKGNSSFQSTTARPDGARSTNLGPKFLTLNTGYSSMDISTAAREGKADLFEIKGHIQTQYSFFMDFKYWQAKTSDASLSQNNSFQKGNPEFLLGFNWIRIGNGKHPVGIDLYGGFSMSSDNSAFATSRNDQIVGMITSKKIDNLLVGLTLEMKMTGTPDKTNELDIGNIRKVGVGMGWIVANNIRFQGEVNIYKVSLSTKKDFNKKLENDLSFSVASPKLFLKLTENTEMELSANFQTRRAKSSQDIFDAKLTSIPGVYGSSIFSGLNYSL